jgi:hypothetical protein
MESIEHAPFNCVEYVHCSLQVCMHQVCQFEECRTSLQVFFLYFGVIYFCVMCVCACVQTGEVLYRLLVE